MIKEEDMPAKETKVAEGVAEEKEVKKAKRKTTTAKVKPEVVEETKSEAVVEAKPEVKMEVKPEATVDAKPEAVVETKPETKVEMKPETRAKAKTGAKVMGKDEIIEVIKGMTVVDLADLVKALEDEFGVSAAPVAVGAVAAAAPGQPAEAAPAEEEKTEFTIVLKEIGEKKIEVIKAVREVTDLGLKQAKDLVEAAPQAVKENISREEMTTIKDKLEAAGATIEIK